MHTVMESGGLRFPNRGVPKNAVRHAFATKNAVKGEVAMGVEGGSPMQWKKCQENFAKPWAMVLTLASFAIAWYGQAPCIRI